MNTSGSTKAVTTRECFAKAHALLTRMHYGGIDFFQSQECTNLMHEFFVMDTRREGQPDEPAAVLEKVAQAYGYLWHVNNEPGAPAQFDPETAAYLARRILRDMLTSEQRGKGITDARHEMSGCKIPPPGWRCTREAGHAGPCAAINDQPETKDAKP